MAGRGADLRRIRRKRRKRRIGRVGRERREWRRRRAAPRRAASAVFVVALAGERVDGVAQRFNQPEPLGLRALVRARLVQLPQLAPQALLVAVAAISRPPLPREIVQGAAQALQFAPDVAVLVVAIVAPPGPLRRPAIEIATQAFEFLLEPAQAVSPFALGRHRGSPRGSSWRTVDISRRTARRA